MNYIYGAAYLGFYSCFAVFFIIYSVFFSAAEFVCKAHKYSHAIDLYTQAIELNGENAVYWANRAFAHTKLEEYGSAILDATKAIEIDPKYSKARFLLLLFFCSCLVFLIQKKNNTHFLQCFFFFNLDFSNWII